MRESNKEEYLSMLRRSADWQHYRASLILSCVLLGFGLLFLLFVWVFLADVAVWWESAEAWGASALLVVPSAVSAVYDWYRLRDLLQRWDQYVYARATVGREHATLDWRYPATSLEVMSRGGAEPGMSMPTRNIFHQREAFGMLDWPLVSEYANCRVLAAFDQKSGRAIILQRDYTKYT